MQLLLILSLEIECSICYNMNRLIEDGEEWIDMMLARNSLSHLYDEETSRKIYKEIKEKYIKLLEKLNNKFENLI